MKVVEIRYFFLQICMESCDSLLKSVVHIAYLKLIEKEGQMMFVTHTLFIFNNGNC